MLTPAVRAVAKNTRDDIAARFAFTVKLCALPPLGPVHTRQCPPAGLFTAWFTSDLEKSSFTENMEQPDVKTLRLTLAATREDFELLILPSMEPSALALAVAARAGVESTASFYLTATQDPKGAVVPLSCSLAAGTSLVVHTRMSGAVQRFSTAASVTDQPTRSAPETSTLTTPLLAPGAGSINAPPQQASASLPASSPSAVPSPVHRGASSGSVGGAVVNQLEGLERLSRLTTDLANERTLLAWIRTCLAGIRTLFTYLSISADEAAWRVSITVAEMCMATLVLACAALGAWRYFVIKKIIGQKVPPKHFGRASIRPLCVLLLFVAAATSTGIYAHQWHHLEPKAGDFGV